MSGNPTTIDDTKLDEEQPKATVRSTLAMPIDPPEIIPPTLEEIRQFINDANQDEDNQERKATGERVANYYFGRLQLKELEDYLKNRFPETWQDKFKVCENFVKSVSRQLSTIYKKSPTRDPIAERGEKVSETDLKANDDLIDFIYKRGKLDTQFQEIERFAKWARSILIKVGYKQSTKKMTLKPYSPQFWDVMTTEDGDLRAVVISDWVPNNAEDENKQARRYWVYTQDVLGMMLQGPDLNIVEEGVENELGVIPFHLFNDEPAVENEKPYLHPDTLMSNTNLAINKNLTDGESLIEYQIYGMPYIIGGDPDNMPDQTGHNQFMHIARGTMDDKDPVIGILQPQADIDGLLKFMERLANGYATSRGLAPDSFSAEKTQSPQSGVSLKLKNHVLIEMRDSEESKYEGLENEIFPLVRAISNAWNGVEGGHSFGEISEKVKLEMDFKESDEAFENEAEGQRQALAEVNQGLLCPTDFVGRRYPRKNKEERLEYLKECQEQRQELGMGGSLEDLDRSLDVEDESPDSLPEDNPGRGPGEGPGRRRGPR
jgi:hypothetical protein